MNKDKKLKGNPEVEKRIINITKDEWPDPQSLMPPRVGTRDPFPIDSLPPILKGAVQEAAQVTQAPIEMVASCFLTSAAAACQGHFDVKVDEHLATKPIGLYALVIAESGDRKSTVDKIARTGHELAQKDWVETNQRVKAEYDAEKSVWEIKKKEFEKNIGKAGREQTSSKKSFNSDRRELADGDVEITPTKLADHLMDAPKPIKQFGMLIQDATTEAIKKRFTEWPSQYLCSDEAGAVFGGHSMRKETVTSHLALMNTGWDGNPLRVARASVESFETGPIRLSICFQVQPRVLSNFMSKYGNLARGSGFLARFLIVQPQSLQGNRPYPKERNQSTGHIDVFSDESDS